jgi:putative transposase
MPDHLHTMISFPLDQRMSDVVGKWKSYNKRKYRIIWQEGYFDHRIRNDAVLDEKQRI